MLTVRQALIYAVGSAVLGMLLGAALVFTINPTRTDTFLRGVLAGIDLLQCPRRGPRWLLLSWGVFDARTAFP